MARGGMRVGEVLKLTPRDVQDRKLTLRDPKSGKEREHVFIPQKVADRLKEYIRDKNIQPDQRDFSHMSRSCQNNGEEGRREGRNSFKAV